MLFLPSWVLGVGRAGKGSRAGGLTSGPKWLESEETVTIETLARCNSWLVGVVRDKYGRL